MKAGDKVWVKCEVEDLDFEGSTVGYRGYRFFAYSKDCKPVEPELNPSEIPNGSSDAVNPLHYKQGPIECIEAIKAALVDGFPDYLRGNVIKYLWRYKEKNGIEDLRKSAWYLDRLIKEVGE